MSTTTRHTSIPYRLQNFRGVQLWMRQHGVRYALRAGIGMTAACVVVVAAQLLYPRNRALPFTQLYGTTVSFSDTTSIQSVFTAQHIQPLEVRAAHKTYQVTRGQVGLLVDEAETIRRVTYYPMSARLVPFSSLFYGRRTQSQQVVVPRIDEAKVQIMAKQIVAENYRAPKEGSVAVVGGKVTVTPPVSGTAYDPAAVAAELRKLAGVHRSIATLTAQTVPPVFDEEALAAAQAEAERYAAKPVVVTADGKTQHIAADTILEWVRFAPDAATKRVKVALDKAPVVAALDTLNRQVYRAASASTVTLADGQEVARTGGAAGRALNTGVTADRVIEAVTSGKTSAAGVAYDLPSPGRYIRTYSNTSNGMRVLIEDWVHAHGGAQWGIMVRELGGLGRSAGYMSTKQFFSASVYKPYVSLLAQVQIAAGQLDPATPTSAGQTVDQCIEAMIVVSSNSCGKSVGGMLGWPAVGAYAASQGFGSTSSAESNFMTSASDLALFMQKVGTGTLMPAAQNDRMLSMLRRQIYRKGIPAGSGGAAVGNKVGFYGGYVHDAGIVYHPRGAYAIAVMSSGGSYALIADFARAIYNYMNQ